jgi:hypothetical protein
MHACLTIVNVFSDNIFKFPCMYVINSKICLQWNEIKWYFTYVRAMTLMFRHNL